MVNNIRYEVMREINYEEITTCIGNNPKQQRWKDYPEWGAELLQFHAPDTRLYVGAYKGDKLVGCMIAHPDTLKIRGRILNAAVIGITEVLMANRKQGIASNLLEKMLRQLEAFNFDLVLAFQTAGRGGKSILKRVGFRKIHKYGHAGKALDKDKMDKLMDLNPILRKIALKIINSKIGEVKPTRGSVRKAKYDDLDQINDLLNAETERLDISSVWTSEYLKRMMDWRYEIFVLENQGKILGSIIGYEEIATLGKDYFTSGLLKEMVFDEEVSELDRIILLNNALQFFKIKQIPSVSYPYPKNVKKILKKAGFNVLPGDERTTFVKALTNVARETLNVISKFRYINVFLIC